MRLNEEYVREYDFIEEGPKKCILCEALFVDGIEIIEFDSGQPMCYECYLVEVHLKQESKYMT